MIQLIKEKTTLSTSEQINLTNVMINAHKTVHGAYNKNVNINVDIDMKTAFDRINAYRLEEDKENE